MQTIFDQGIYEYFNFHRAIQLLKGFVCLDHVSHKKNIYAQMTIDKLYFFVHESLTK